MLRLTVNPHDVGSLFIRSERFAKRVFIEVCFRAGTARLPNCNLTPRRGRGRTARSTSFAYGREHIRTGGRRGRVFTGPGGSATIAGDTGVMTVRLKDSSGATLYSVDLEPGR
ncbi:hypothetical protein GBA63_19340 [Rubrobacter tropicus]|uniref:Uncharacterized protein n=1 Tax=Rubrobacter tropicus TaxID=2653851 RepID=A0A6G8QDI4_9ACTN|nr:hypothetical protein GBA63_19340 [Rubrobacter tropicus]